jgi:K+-transporting ATPase KdpF subunit
LGVRERLRPPLGETMEYIVALAIAAGLGVYLFYALLRPEKF